MTSRHYAVSHTRKHIENSPLTGNVYQSTVTIFFLRTTMQQHKKCDRLG